MRGLFISFEGTEGSGKSTQIQRLAQRLAQAGYPVLAIREPGGTPVSEQIRHLLKQASANHAISAETELLLMAASRAQLVRQIIRPALKKGAIVLSDRFADSTVAYQGFGRRLPLEQIAPINLLATAGLKPDLTLLLMIPIRLSEQRRRRRPVPVDEATDRFEQEDRAFFRRVERGYRALARSEPDRIQIIDAAQSVTKVQENIWRKIGPLLLAWEQAKPRTCR